MNLKKLFINIALACVALLLLFFGIRHIRNQSPRHDLSGTPFTIWFPDFDVHTMAQQDSILWLGGKDGVIGLNMNTFQEKHLPDTKTKLKFVRGMAIDSMGVLWIGHQGGLASYDGHKVVEIDEENGLPDNDVNTVYLDRLNQLWIGTWSGAFYYSNGSWIAPEETEGLLAPMVNVIYQDEQLGYWFGSYIAPRGGLSYLHNGQWYYFTHRDFLPHANITGIIEDHGKIWVGTGLFNKGGAVCIDTKKMGNKEANPLQLSKKDGLKGDKVRSLYRDSLGQIWFGFEYDGITIYNQEGMKHITIREGLSNNEVKCFLLNQQGLWIGTRGGLTLFQGKLGLISEFL